MTAGNETVFVNQTEKYVRVVGERNYVTASAPGDNPIFKRFMSERDYAEALSGLPIECVDMLIYNPQNDSFLIGTRQQEPQAGDWVIGGRMQAGESVEDTAVRKMNKELGLQIDPDKLQTVAHYNMVWDTREQPPVAVVDETTSPAQIIGYSKGCHTGTTLELYTLSPDEAEQINHNEEYSSLRWIKLEEVLDAPTGDYHPCLVDMFEDGLDVVTTPGTPKDAAGARLRLVGAAATAQSALRRFDEQHSQKI